MQCEIIDTSSRDLTGRGNHNNYQLWLMIESADNFEQWVDAIVMFYCFPGNLKRKIDILMKMLYFCSNWRDTNKDCRDILTLDDINHQRGIIY